MMRSQRTLFLFLCTLPLFFSVLQGEEPVPPIETTSRSNLSLNIIDRISSTISSWIPFGNKESGKEEKLLDSSENQREAIEEKTNFAEKNLPASLANIPSGESMGIVLDVKTIPIPDVYAPYNASLVSIPNERGFFLFFRYDQFCPEFGEPLPLGNTLSSPKHPNLFLTHGSLCSPNGSLCSPKHQHNSPFYTSHIGCVKLDEHCNPIEKHQEILLSNCWNEDPRAFWHDSTLYLCYNSLATNSSKKPKRVFKLAKLDEQTMQVEKEMTLELDRQQIEKNWTPFSFIDGEQDRLLFKRYLIPNQNVLLVENFSSTTTQTLSKEEELFLIDENVDSESEKSNMYWPILWTKPFEELPPLFENAEEESTSLQWATLWGTPRGGSPALRINDDEYLAFFHSSFRDEKGCFYYVMGAYTFEAFPPFRIHAISTHPLLFKGAFTTPSLNTAHPSTRCLFPCGLTRKKVDGRDTFYLSIGENDSCIKVLQLDKDALLASLQPIP